MPSQLDISATVRSMLCSFAPDRMVDSNSSIGMLWIHKAHWDTQDHKWSQAWSYVVMGSRIYASGFEDKSRLPEMTESLRLAGKLGVESSCNAMKADTAS